MSVQILLSREEQTELFRRLEAQASECFYLSKNVITEGFLILNRIRTERLFVHGGYTDWKSYLESFLDHNGISRSLVYENLHVLRLASAAGFTNDEIAHFGMYAIRPYFESGALKPIQDYDRATGEITVLQPALMAKLPQTDDITSAYGSFVKSLIQPGDPPAMSRTNLAIEMESEIVFFSPVLEDGKTVNIEWLHTRGEKVLGNGYLKDMPQYIQEELSRRLHRR